MVLVRVAMSLLLLLLAGCKVDLVTGLSQRQANEAIALLQRHQIDVDKRADGKKAFKVIVAKSQFPDAVRLLSEHALPSRDDVSIGDIFPADSLVTTPMSERARLLSGIEQRLEKTVASIANVATARVHASYPIASDDRRKPPAMRMSIVVNYEGDVAEDLFAEKIKRVARNSFDGLAYEDISVVLFRRRGTDVDLLPLPDDTATAPPWIAWVAVGLAVLATLAAGGIWWRRRRGSTPNSRDAGVDDPPAMLADPIDDPSPPTAA